MSEIVWCKERGWLNEPEPFHTHQCRPVGYEARCNKCGETFVPADENDLVHCEREDGTPCEGNGTLLGAWY